MWRSVMGFTRITDDFQSLGYHISYELLMTANFEVPQKRERVLSASDKDELRILALAYFPNLLGIDQKNMFG